MLPGWPVVQRPTETASVYDYVAGGGAAGAAVPILARHLGRPHHPRVWEGIVRALSTSAARVEALGPLRDAYRVEAAPERRWLLANALGAMASFDEVADLNGIASTAHSSAGPAQAAARRACDLTWRWS
jgi:hypothetical protein